MNMIQERYLIWGSRELAIIIVTLVQITRLMAKFEVYDIKTIVTMIIIVFVLMVVFIYCNLQLLLMEILYFIRNKINSKKVININTLFYKTKDTIPANTLSLDSIPMNTASSDIINDNINNVSIRKAQNKKHKFNIAKEYITETFSPYCSNEEVENICAAIIDYSKGETDFSKYPSVEIKGLNNLDLYHFAWSIWNHFRVGKQDVIVKFLKVIFKQKLLDVDVKTIKSHLKDDENKGIVKIKEDLSKPNE